MASVQNEAGPLGVALAGGEVVVVLLYAVCLTCLVATLVPLSKHEAWWIRACDFPRAQIVIVALIAGALLIGTADMGQITTRLLLLALVAAIAYQLAVIVPYTPIWRPELLNHTVSHAAPPGDRSLSILVVNVLMPNRQTDRLFALIRAHDPDVLLAVETDAWWCARFAEHGADYPHRLVHPLDNTYGMLLYSKLELVAPEIRFLLKPDVPSIRTGVRLRSGREIKFYGLHPEPPSPTEADSSLPRDVELVLVGREVGATRAPTVVAGDLNDVAWSHTSRLFRRLSRLLDPRIGRGMFNTFHAGFWPLRWPLDHVFVSDAFVLRTIRRLPAFGSDHFPIFIVLEHRPAVADRHDPAAADDNDHAEADGKLAQVGLDPTGAAGRD